MRVMVLVKANTETEAGVLPSTEMFAEMGKFNEELTKAGIMLAGEGLHPSSKGMRVRFTEHGPEVVQGPFGATGELVAGFWLWRVRSIDEAIDWAKRAPFEAGAELEIRPLHEAEDFGANLTPELREQEERLRQQIAQREETRQRKAS
jgi:hypothetical protein